MTVTQDERGNYFEGNTVSGSPWSPEKLLLLMRTALGSDDRALLSKYDDGEWRIDWRPNENTTQETITGAINTSQGNYIQNKSSTTVTQKNLADNARFALSLTYVFSTDLATRVVSPYLMKSGIVDNFVDVDEPLAHQFTSAASFWAVARDSMVAFFIKSGTNTFFIAQGLLLDARLPFPGGQFSLASKGGVRTKSAVQNGTSLIPIATSGEIANFGHIRKSDDTPTNSEVELYLRQASDGIHLGYAANLWKAHINDSETEPNIGDIVVLDLSSATNYYQGEGEIPCIVAARLGNASSTDLTGDYIFMRIAQ